MRYIAVTIPADFAFAYSRHHVIDLASIDQCGVEVGVTTNAIVHDDLVSSLTGTWSLTFAVSNKLGNMIEAISSLEEVLAYNVLVRYMTVVAGGITRMARMEPRGIVGCHDVAIDTSRRVVAQITVGSKNVQEEKSTSYKRSKQDEANTLLTTGEPVNKSGYNIHNTFFFSTKQDIFL